jgi:16S rRNA (uracil1498-N3)-methyltransferase
VKWASGLQLLQFRIEGDLMHKFFVESKNIYDDNIVITGDDVNHMVKVLRLRHEEKIQISNGEGAEYICSIQELNKKEVVCNILEASHSNTEANVGITLFQGLPKAQKMELIVQKCVEIGIKKIQPVVTKRVVVKLESRDISGKLERWQRIAEEAAKQSNRGIIPKVLHPITFDEAVKQLEAMDLSIVPYEKERAHGLKKLLSKAEGVKDVGVFIGPEGGFEEEEIDICLSRGISPVSLGPRILRTETAGFVAASIILYELGDMGGV